MPSEHSLKDIFRIHIESLEFQIKWEFGEKQPVDPRCSIENKDNTSVLSIPQCSRDNSGKYTIVCKNLGGTRTASCKLIVKGKKLLVNIFQFGERTDQHWPILHLLKIVW